jgi:hypothetical protein
MGGCPSIEEHIRRHVIDPACEPNATTTKGAEELIELVQSYLK